MKRKRDYLKELYFSFYVISLRTILPTIDVQLILAGDETLYYLI